MILHIYFYRKKYHIYKYMLACMIIKVERSVAVYSSLVALSNLTQIEIE